MLKLKNKQTKTEQGSGVINNMNNSNENNNVKITWLHKYTHPCVFSNNPSHSNPC